MAENAYTSLTSVKTTCAADYKQTVELIDMAIGSARTECSETMSNCA